MTIMAMKLTMHRRMWHVERLFATCWAQSLAIAFPEIAGLGFPLVLGHVPDDVTTSTSKAQPSVLGAGEPGYVAGALPLPRAGVAVARTAVQMAFALILKKPVPGCLLVCSAPKA